MEVNLPREFYGGKRKNKSDEESLQLPNPHLQALNGDFLYHLGFGKTTHDLEAMFGDVKFVCMGGTSKRMETFAYYVRDIINPYVPTGMTLEDMTQHYQRFSMFKVGPVLSISHGMGMPSIGILLHEITKLLYHAKVKNPIFFRIGTCGGIGCKAGTVVISNHAIDGQGNHFHELSILGNTVRRPTIFNKELIQELKNCVDPNNTYQTIEGTTMGADDFYEGQGRLDGAICDYTVDDKMKYLQKLKTLGVVNIEMECTLFAAFTHHAGIKAADVCVTFLDRLEGDQVITPKETLNEWQLRPQKLVATYIKRSLDGLCS